MTKIKPKLYLNMSPQTTEEGSLAYARNMKIDDDGNLVSDFGYNNIAAMANYNIVGHIVGLNDNIYFFCSTLENNVWTNSKIVVYNEIRNDAIELSTSWSYSGGSITGCVTNNQTGETILTICEYLENDSSIPIKHINLNHLGYIGESLYCQAPACPTINLILDNTYVKTIPNGVYVFFIRYKIRKDVYTNWFLCSRPIFGGTSEKINTLQGGLSYINTHKDSAKSFIFKLDIASNTNINSYEEFQLGFIISHDDATDARIWKSFTFPSDVNTYRIYFDYDNVKETNIDNLLATTYELYDVRNITSFKNKLYISNYGESNFNDEDISDIADSISLNYTHSSNSSSSDITYISGNYKNKGALKYNNSLGFFDKIGDNDDNITANTISGDLIYTPSKLMKDDVITKDSIVTFNVKWDDNWKPGGSDSDDYVDIAIVNNIHNGIYDNLVYGDDYSVPYNEGLVGIKRTARPSKNKSVFAPDQMSGSGDYDTDLKYLSSHPWYDENLTFGFGCLDNGAFGINLCKFKRTGTKYRWSSNTNKGWLADNTELDDIRFSEITDTFKEECEEKSKLVKCYLEVSYGTKTYKIEFHEAFDNDSFAISEEDSSQEYSDVEFFDKESIDTSALLNAISGYVRTLLEGNNSDVCGISDTGVPIVRFYDNGSYVYIPVENVAIKFKLFEFSLDFEDLGTSGDVKLNKKYRINLKTTNYTSICNVKFNDGLISINDNSSDYSQASTLMPYSKYQPYIHFVDEHNIITNGIKYGSTIDTGGIYNNVDTLQLSYSIANLDDTVKKNYKSFFVSLANIGNIVIECFGYEKTNGMHIINSIELDSMLYNINDNIIVFYDNNGVKTQITDKAKYYSSGESYPSLAFGNCGFVGWPVTNNANYYDKKLYIEIIRDSSKENAKELIKATEYIPLANTSGSKTVIDGFYNSYFCIVKKPDFVLSSNVYVSGNDVYSVDRSASLKLIDFNNYIQVQNSKSYFIRSNFNLNYLSLTEDIPDKIFSIGGAATGLKQVAKVVNSAILSYIYELKSMYKSFFNKVFSEVVDEYNIYFGNTIRVSNVLSDESYNNSVFKFESQNYYNVPTDRGIIVKLFSIGNNIFVHTKGSFYKFDATQTIMASDSDITLKESEPFETGIVQLFDSQYGYGGIDNKEAGCITFDSYVFYDKTSNHIFAYSGNGQIQLIDGTIYKFLKLYKFSICYTLHDDNNHRVLFNFADDDKGICLSYNYKAKSFVSVHDITLYKSFSSRTKCYSYNSTLCDLFIANTISTTVLDASLNLRTIYGGASFVSNLFFGANNDFTNTSPFSIAVILYPSGTIREVLNNIKYISDIIKEPIKNKNINGTYYDFIANPEHTYYNEGVAINPVDSLYIVTDSCVSDTIQGTINDTTRVGREDYKAIRHDIDSWNVNYFRNKLHSDNVVNYPGETGAGSPGQPRVDYRKTDSTTDTYHPNSDNHSLVYGKHFIIVFNFKKEQPIKFEEIFIITNSY